MAVTIRASLVLAAAALAALALRAFADPPAPSEIDAAASSSCDAGTQQSPVDLGQSIAAMAPPMTTRWHTVDDALIDNTGKMLSVHLRLAGGMSLQGVEHELERIDIRAPSEHTLDGRPFPAELQLTHRSPDGHLVMIAVPIVEGKADPTLERILATAPGRAGRAAVSFSIDVRKLADVSGGMWRYEGSLTSAPCSETVSWGVLTTPLSASRAQIVAISSLHPNSARATQPLNRRYVLKSP